MANWHFHRYVEARGESCNLKLFHRFIYGSIIQPSLFCWKLIFLKTEIVVFGFQVVWNLGYNLLRLFLNQNRHPLQSNLVNYLGDIFKVKPLLTFGFANLDKSQYGQIEWNVNVELIDSGSFLELLVVIWYWQIAYCPSHDYW